MRRTQKGRPRSGPLRDLRPRGRDRALYPLARVARGIGPALGLVPGLMVCAIDGGAGGELPGRLAHAAAKAIREVESAACVRSEILGWRDRGLYPLAWGGSRRRGDSGSRRPGDRYAPRDKDDLASLKFESEHTPDTSFPGGQPSHYRDNRCSHPVTAPSLACAMIAHVSRVGLCGRAYGDPAAGLAQLSDHVAEQILAPRQQLSTRLAAQEEIFQHIVLFARPQRGTTDQAG